MKITLDMENLETLIQDTAKENLESVIKEQVNSTIFATINNLAKKKIEEAVADNFQRFVDEYIKNTLIKVGGGFWNDDDEKSYTVEQFIKQELKNRLESKSLKVKKSGRSGSYSDDYKQVSFEEYIKNTFNVDELIRKDLDSFMDDVRKDINRQMKEMFDESTKTMLSGAVLNILAANDTYQKIENQIKSIADKKE